MKSIDLIDKFNIQEDIYINKYLRMSIKLVGNELTILPDEHASDKALNILELITKKGISDVLSLGDKFFSFRPSRYNNNDSNEILIQREKEFITKIVELTLKIENYIQLIGNWDEFLPGIILKDGIRQDFQEGYNKAKHYINILKNLPKPPPQRMIENLDKGMEVFFEMLKENPALIYAIDEIISKGEYIRHLKINGKDIIFAHSILKENQKGEFKEQTLIGINYGQRQMTQEEINEKKKIIKKLGIVNKRKSDYSVNVGKSVEITKNMLMGTILQEGKLTDSNQYIFIFGHIHAHTTSWKLNESGVFIPKTLSQDDIINIKDFNGLINLGTLGGAIDNRDYTKSHIATINKNDGTITINECP